MLAPRRGLEGGFRPEATARAAQVKHGKTDSGPHMYPWKFSLTTYVGAEVECAGAVSDFGVQLAPCHRRGNAALITLYHRTPLPSAAAAEAAGTIHAKFFAAQETRVWEEARTPVRCAVPSVRCSALTLPCTASKHKVLKLQCKF